MNDRPAPDLPTATGDALAGVQGDSPAATRDGNATTAPLQETPDAPTPDAGKIEWAGGAIKKPPHPAN